METGIQTEATRERWNLYRRNPTSF